MKFQGKRRRKYHLLLAAVSMAAWVPASRADLIVSNISDTGGASLRGYYFPYFMGSANLNGPAVVESGVDYQPTQGFFGPWSVTGYADGSAMTSPTTLQISGTGGIGVSGNVEFFGSTTFSGEVDFTVSNTGPYLLTATGGIPGDPYLGEVTFSLVGTLDGATVLSLTQTAANFRSSNSLSFAPQNVTLQPGVDYSFVAHYEGDAEAENILAASATVNVSLTEVPEPASAMSIAAISGLALTRRRKPSGRRPHLAHPPASQPRRVPPRPAIGSPAQ